MSINEQPSYYAIIPANVRYDNKLKANEKLLYGEITCLSQSTGKCFASNDYFANLYGTSKETVSRWISNLSKQGYIKTQLIYKDGTKQIINRYIQINQEGIDENINSPIDEKAKDNNTSINTTSIIKKINKKDLDLSEVEHFIYKSNVLEFIEHRKDIRKPMTQLALSKFLNKLNKYMRLGFNVIELIDNSISAGYSDIYEPKQKQFQNNFQQETKAQRNRRIIDEVFAEQEANIKCDFDVEIIE